MKTILLLLCCSSMAFGQSDVSRSLDRVANELETSRIENTAHRFHLEQKQERKQFEDDMGQAMDNFTRARLIKLQTDRAARDAAIIQQQAKALRDTAPVPVQIVTVKSPVAEQEQSRPKEGRFQLVSQNGVILKLDTATGQTLQFLQSTNGNASWKDVSDTDTINALATQKRLDALIEWDQKKTEKDPNFAKLKKPFYERATQLIDKRTEEAGRMLSPEELVEQAEAAYQEIKNPVRH